MVKIQRTHDVPLELSVTTLKEVSFHRCLLDNLDFSCSKLVCIVTLSYYKEKDLLTLI